LVSFQALATSHRQLDDANTLVLISALPPQHTTAKEHLMNKCAPLVEGKQMGLGKVK
jgi:hypothetical protein